MVPLAPKLKVITYHFISYRRKSVLNLVEIQNTFVVVLSPGCPQLPEIQNTFVRTFVRTKVPSFVRTFVTTFALLGTKVPSYLHTFV